MMTATVSNKNDSPEQWSEDRIAKWYAEGNWKHGFKAIPDATINQREMAVRYHRNPERWKKAFTFLAEQDLKILETGRHELEGSELFALVDEYLPKYIDDTQFEAHRIFADIQYVISGKEQISTAPVDTAVITTPYDEGKDVLFLSVSKGKDRKATPGNFFVFFPSNAHRPSVRLNNKTRVKKIVMKLKLD